MEKIEKTQLERIYFIVKWKKGKDDSPIGFYKDGKIVLPKMGAWIEPPNFGDTWFVSGSVREKVIIAFPEFRVTPDHIDMKDKKLGIFVTGVFYEFPTEEKNIDVKPFRREEIPQVRRPQNTKPISSEEQKRRDRVEKIRSSPRDIRVLGRDQTKNPKKK